MSRKKIQAILWITILFSVPAWPQQQKNNCQQSGIHFLGNIGFSYTSAQTWSKDQLNSFLGASTIIQDDTEQPSDLFTGGGIGYFHFLLDTLSLQANFYFDSRAFAYRWLATNLSDDRNVRFTVQFLTFSLGTRYFFLADGIFPFLGVGGYYSLLLGKVGVSWNGTTNLPGEIKGNNDYGWHAEAGLGINYLEKMDVFWVFRYQMGLAKIVDLPSAQSPATNIKSRSLYFQMEIRYGL